MSTVEQHHAKPHDVRFDLLRSIAMLAVILAHLSPPTLILQIRNFDVPLLVLVSGAVFALSSEGRKMSYGWYLKHRFARLLLPVWTFYLAYFLIRWLLSLALPGFHAADLVTIERTLLFQSSVSFVWIIRVFLLVALVSPLFLSIRRRLGGDLRYATFLLLAYIFYLGMLEFWQAIPHPPGPFALFFTDYVFYLFPYGILCGIGILLPRMERRTAVVFSLVSFLFFAVLALDLMHWKLLTSNFVPTQDFKYPPRTYYLSYALGFSFLLFATFSRVREVPGEAFRRAVAFFSRSSLWIYLWHTIFLSLLPSLPIDSLALKFLFIVVVSSATVFLQRTLVRAILARSRPSPIESFLRLLA